MMSNELQHKGALKQIWLLLYLEGGWWTTREVRPYLDVPDRTLKALPQLLNHMVTVGLIESKNEPDHQLELRIRFGVTKNCRIPSGIHIRELEAMLAPQPLAA